MTDPIRYPHAPINEAILDIRCLFTNPIGLELLSSIHENFSKDYPIKEDIILTSAQITFAQGKLISSADEPQIVGYKFKSEDGLMVCQIKPDGFTFNLLDKYISWEDFSKKAFAAWKMYKDNTQPIQTPRIALRYINKINLPFDDNKVEFDDYIVTMPPIPKGLPQTLNHFFVQLNVPGPANENVVITQTIDRNPTLGDSIPFLLDIDVSKTESFSSEYELSDEFEALRKLKNEVFESCIKDKTRKLFQDG